MRYHSGNPAVLAKVFQILAEGVEHTTDKELARSVVEQVTPLVLAALNLHCTKPELQLHCQSHSKIHDFFYHAEAAEAAAAAAAAAESIEARRVLSHKFFAMLARHDSFQVALAAKGGIPLIFAAMKKYRADSEVCKHCCLLLARIVSRNAAYKDTVKAAGGVAFAHVTMTSWPDNKYAKEWATELITALQ